MEHARDPFEFFESVEAALEHLLGASTDLFLVLDADCRVRRAWGSLFEAQGLDAGEIVGLTPEDLFDERVARHLISLCDRALAGETVVDEGRLDQPPFDGAFVQRFSPIRDAGESIVGVAVSVRDISRRYAAERSLAESEQRWRRIVESSPLGMLFYRLEEDGRLILQGANAAADDILGVSLPERFGMTIEEAFPPLAETEIPDAYRRAARDGVNWQTNLVEYEADDITGSYEVYAFQTRSMEMAVMFEDVTERRVAAVELERHREHLERLVTERTAEYEAASRAKSEFLASMSHELRTPMNSIIGFTGVLLQGLAGNLTAEQEKQLRMVEGSAGHLLELINEILDLTKIEAGKMSLEVGPVDIAEIAGEVVGTLAPLAAEKGVELAAGELPDPGSGTVRSDAHRVRQVLMNLVGNAIRYTNEGHVIVGAELAQTGPGRRGGDLLVHVRDTGVGIAEDDQERIFQEFVQLETGVDSIRAGTGLGLTVSREIARTLGGEITVESMPGKGSTFTLALPKEPP